MHTISECAQLGARVTQAGVAKVRRVVRFNGFTGGVDIGVHNNTLVNGARGLLERVLKYRRPDGTLEDLPALQRHVSDLGPFVARLREHVRTVTPWRVEDFLNTYTGRQKAMYTTAAQSLAQKPLEPKDAWVGPSFVKAEKINFSAKDDPAPRIIQPRSPRYNIEVGVFLKRIEKATYNAIAGVYGGTTVLKGLTPQGIARELRNKWEDFTDPMAVGLDASRFDQHVRTEMLRFEHSVYLLFFRGAHRRRLKRLLSWQLANRGLLRCSDGTIKYTVNGSRMSGDMNTSLGNCTIMCALVWLFLQERRIKAHLANNGDDCVLILERGDLSRLQGLDSWFLKWGFRMKVEKPVGVFEHIEFCQTHPVWDGQTWVMCRDPRVAIAKDLTITDPSLGHGAGLRKWMHAVGSGGLAVAGGMPVFTSLYNKLEALGTPGEVSGAKSYTGYLATALPDNRRGRVVTDEARVSFYHAFGITPTLQRAWEAEINSTWVLPTAPGKLFPHWTTDPGPKL